MRALFLLLCLLSAQAWATTRHVTATGAGAADGTSEANAYAGFVTAMAAMGTSDTLCLHGSFTGTANRQASGIMFRPTVSGNSSADTIYDGDCGGTGTNAIVDCNSQEAIGIRTSGASQTTYATVKNIDVQHCTNKNIVTYFATTDETNDAYLTFDNVRSYDAQGSSAGNCFDNRGQHVTLRDFVVDGCNEDGGYTKGKYFTVDGYTARNVSRANTNGDGLQLAGNADYYHIANVDCDHAEKDSKQCLIISALTDTGAYGIAEDLTLRCYPGATVMNCLYVTGAGAKIRHAYVTGGNYGVAVEGLGTSTNMELSSIIQDGATLDGISVFSGAGAGNKIYNSSAINNGLHGFLNSSSNAVVFQNNAAARNASCGINTISGDTETYNDSYNNGTAFCQAGVSTAAGTGSATDVPGWVGGPTPTTAAGFCLNSDSALLGAGTYIGAYIYGYGGESLTNPPPIGARGLCQPRIPAAARQPAGIRVAN